MRIPSSGRRQRFAVSEANILQPPCGSHIASARRLHDLRSQVIRPASGGYRILTGNTHNMSRMKRKQKAFLDLKIVFWIIVNYVPLAGKESILSEKVWQKHWNIWRVNDEVLLCCHRVQQCWASGIERRNQSIKEEAAGTCGCGRWIYGYYFQPLRSLRHHEYLAGIRTGVRRMMKMMK